MVRLSRQGRRRSRFWRWLRWRKWTWSWRWRWKRQWQPCRRRSVFGRWLWKRMVRQLVCFWSKRLIWFRKPWGLRRGRKFPRRRCRQLRWWCKLRRWHWLEPWAFSSRFDFLRRRNWRCNIRKCWRIKRSRRKSWKLGYRGRKLQSRFKCRLRRL